MARWFDIKEEVSIRVSLDGRPFRLDFYDYDSVKDVELDNDEARQKKGEKIARHISPRGKDFLGKGSNRGMKKRLTKSDLDFNDDKAEEIIESFARVAEDKLEKIIEEREQKAEEEQIIRNYDYDEEELEQKAEEWLESSDLISKINRVIHHHLAGETKNSLLVFLMILSAKTQRPGSLRPIGKSSVGKSYIVENVARLFPKQMMYARTSFSKMAPWNKAEPTDVEGVRDWNLWGKCIIIKEEENSEEFLEQFRDVLARNDPVNIYEVTDTESQERDTLKVRMVGWPSYIGLRVDPHTEEQESSRAMSMTPNAGKEKYGKSQWFQGKKDQHIWEENLREKETQIIRKAISMLDSYRVIIPHLDEIQKHFPNSRSEHQRHYQYFLALIRAMTILHQRQRVVVEVGEKDCLIASPEDVKAVLRIADKALANTVEGVDERAQKMWKEIKNLDGVKGYSGLQDTYKDIFGERMGKSTLKRKFVEPLEELNLLHIEEGSGRNPHTFRAKGTLSALSSNFEKIEKACSKEDIEESWFHQLDNNREYTDKIVLKNCPNIDNNPLEEPDLEHLEKAWESLQNVGLIENNKDVLNREYEDDYCSGGKEETDDDTPDFDEIASGEKEEEKEEKEPQNRLMEKLAKFYRNRYTGLETPHIDDFAEVASSEFQEPKSRIKEASKKLKQDTEITFQMEA